MSRTFGPVTRAIIERIMAVATADEAFATASAEMVKAEDLYNVPVEILAVKFDRTRYPGRDKRGDDSYAAVLVRRTGPDATGDVLVAPVGGRVAVAQLRLWEKALPKTATLTHQGIQRWRTDL